ncbi:MAG: hypothetical protein Q8N69_01900 [bacterium]|nr:hypothetical protein [bacterium]
MVKKIFDIIPPGIRSIENFSDRSGMVSGKRKPFKKPVFFGIFIFSVLVLLLAVYFIFPSRADVEIWPDARDIELKERIILNLKQPEIDLEKGIIPAVLYESSAELEREFISSGKTNQESKARGVITVYNEYSDSPRSLVPSRFVSSDGKIFWSKEKITIPGRKKEKSKIVPGQAEARVEASEPGSDYNIDPTTFVLPGLAGSPMYTTIYAKSFSQMAGGNIGQAAQVSETDLKEAEILLLKEAREKNISSIMGKIPENMILADAAVLSEVTGKESNFSVGSIKDHFKFKISVFSKAFIFKKTDLNEFTKYLLGKEIETGEAINYNKLELSYDLQPGENPESAVLEVTIKAMAYKEPDLNGLKRSLEGKSAEEARVLLNGFPNASKIEFRIYPFFKGSFPEDRNKINIKSVLY